MMNRILSLEFRLQVHSVLSYPISSALYAPSSMLVMDCFSCVMYRNTSRPPRAWVSSHWEIDFAVHYDDAQSKKYLAALSAGMPSLRSLGLPFGFGWGNDYTTIGSLPLLERLVFRCSPIADFPFDHCPSLKIVEMQDNRPDGNDPIYLQDTDLGVLGKLELDVFIANDVGSLTDFFDEMSNTKFAEKVRVISLSQVRLSIPSIESMKRYIHIEEIEIEDADDINTGLISRLTSAPSLRVFTVDKVNDIKDMTELLSNNAFKSRVEYLRLQGTFNDCSKLIPQMMIDCISLIGLEIQCRNLVLNTPDRGSMIISLILTAPEEFRLRLRSLTIRYENIEKKDDQNQFLANIRSAYPNLIHLRIDSSRWLYRQKKITHDPMHLARFTPSELLLANRTPLLHWLRVLKLSAGVPLLPSESTSFRLHGPYPSLNIAPDVESFNDRGESFRARFRGGRRINQVKKGGRPERLIQPHYL